MAIAEQFKPQQIAPQKPQSENLGCTTKVTKKAANSEKNSQDTIYVIALLLVAWCLSAIALIWHLW